MSAAQKGHRETHLATAGQKLQALQAKTFMRQRLWPRGEEKEEQAGQEGWPPGAATEVDFEVAAPAISVIISVIIAIIIIINAVTRSCLASGASCHCPFSSPSSPSSTFFLLLLWSHNCQRNKFSILLKHHLHYKCNAVKAKQRSRQISLNWTEDAPISSCNSISVWPWPQHN